MTIWLNAPFQTRFRVIDGLTVRFARSEDRHEQALLLSLWPESLFAFEPVWSWLAEHAHLVAIDLPGFGHSQRCDGLPSPRAMSEFLIRTADAFGLEHPHVTGSWPAATDHPARPCAATTRRTGHPHSNSGPANTGHNTHGEHHDGQAGKAAGS